jgi:hypothetical protein
MNAYETTQALGLTGTDAEIVAALKATGLTAKPIDRATLVHVLNMRGMLTKIVGNDSSEKWTGTVLNMQDVILAMGTDEEKAGIRLWLSHITNPTNLKWDTTQVAFAAPFWKMYQTFAGQTFNNKPMPSATDFQALAALGDGWLFADLDEPTYAAQRTAAEQAAIVAQGLLAVKTKIDTADEAARTESRKTNATVQSIVAAANAAWGA